MPREEVLTAATTRFARDGYDRTTLRALADDARVDAAMVVYLFGSKEKLFREALRLILDPDALVAALAGAGHDDAEIGERMVRTYLGLWEAPQTAASIRAMVASATSHPEANDAFRGFIQDYVLGAVSDILGGGEQARLRAMLAASSLVGTAMLRYVIGVAPLSELPTEDVVRLVAPTVTRYLTADAADLGLPL